MKNFDIHYILDGKVLMGGYSNHLPRKGDLLKISDKRVYEVAQITWRMDEGEAMGQRVDVDIFILEGSAEHGY